MHKAEPYATLKRTMVAAESGSVAVLAEKPSVARDIARDRAEKEGGRH